MHFARPSSPRIEPRADLLERIREAQKGSPVNAINVAGTLAKNKPINRAFGPFAQAVLFEGGLSRRIVELAVLRMGWNCQAIYEFGQHTLFGRDVGLSDAEIYAVTRPLNQHAWADDERIVLQAVDELYADDCVGDATWAAAAERFSEAELIHLVMAAGCYRVVSGVLNSCGVQLDEGVPGWPTPPSS
ncbi:MAG: carboxymuconolactone decarboxylase family protein [Acidimicrobiia bacterium]|nr:carboxymuconolactone decarboxylase family protein [Acidimicrobiia bacterium]